MEGDMEKLPVPIPGAKARLIRSNSSSPLRRKIRSTDRMEEAIPKVSSSTTTKPPRRRRSCTSETSSDERSSELSSDSSGVYQVIEYDPSHQIRYAFSSDLDVTYEDVDGEDYIGTDLDIGEDTPAAAALRASAAVRVSRVGKAARAVHMQALRKILKRAIGTSKQGVVKGKPPRMPPHPSMPLEDIQEESEESSQEEEQQMNESKHHESNYPIAEVVNDHMVDDVVVGTAEAGKTVLRAVDPHNMLKVLRRKKRGNDERRTKSYVKGKVIDGEHELYTLSIAVMIGVRTSISKTNNILNSGPSKRWVLPQDYATTEKYEFRPRGGTGMPAHRLAHTFKFKDYAPVVFAYLRRMSGINDFDFLISVCGNANFIEFISNARSGQFFFYSSDGRFMIKTMTNAESKFLRRILPDYFRHCCENPNTMITKFFGMYRVKLYHLRRNVKFVIMNSVYYTDKYLQTFYDLKGSVVGREAKPGDAVKKDNDLRRALPKEALSLHPETREKVHKQLERDVHFLQQMGIMDYSMLVGIHHVPSLSDRSLATTGYCASPRKSSRRLVTKVDAPGTDSTDVRREETAPSLDAGDPSSSSHNEDDSLSRNFTYEVDFDDDDSSYLKGSEMRPDDSKGLHEDIEQKKLATIENLYWPFHQFYDIHGHRRMTLRVCPTCGEMPCECIPDESLHGYNPKFEPPLSDRKDGGLEMDTTRFRQPMIYKGNSGRQLYQGKIFYMGIIDILQEFNSRKMVEAQYRLFRTSGKTDASCVDPKTYGRRFLEFFNEYTGKSNGGDEEVDILPQSNLVEYGVLVDL